MWLHTEEPDTATIAKGAGDDLTSTMDEAGAQLPPSAAAMTRRELQRTVLPLST